MGASGPRRNRRAHRRTSRGIRPGLPASLNQQIPVIMPDLVAEMAERRAIELAHLVLHAVARAASSPSLSAMVIKPSSWPVSTLGLGVGLGQKVERQPVRGGPRRAWASAGTTASGCRTGAAWPPPACARVLGFPPAIERSGIDACCAGRRCSNRAFGSVASASSQLQPAARALPQMRNRAGRVGLRNSRHSIAIRLDGAHRGLRWGT